MLQLRTIDSLDLPELQPYRTMRRQMDHRREGIFVAEGDKVVQRLLESHLEVVSLLLPEKWFQEFRPLVANRREMVQVFIAEKKLLETLTGYSMYQGVLGIARVPPEATIDSILAANPRPWLLAAAEGLTNADNLGSIIRSAAAFGVQGLVVGETSTSAYLRRAVRSSMGAVFKMPIIESGSLISSLQALKAAGISCVAAHPHVSGRTLPMAALHRDCCIVFGSEGYGLTREALNFCCDAVAIPMADGVDSLNVATAATAFFYEAARQRGKLQPANLSDEASPAANPSTGEKPNQNPHHP
ncbi:MAG: RNA methyltransferase [Verrucomicrobiota bacterium]